MHSHPQAASAYRRRLNHVHGYQPSGINHRNHLAQLYVNREKKMV